MLCLLCSWDFLDPESPNVTLLFILLFPSFVLCECHSWTFNLLLFLQYDWLEYSVQNAACHLKAVS